jgi:hypothetical protein
MSLATGSGALLAWEKRSSQRRRRGSGGFFAPRKAQQHNDCLSAVGLIGWQCLAADLPS